jgi:Ca2+-binding EF-hand superfamily protein
MKELFDNLDQTSYLSVEDLKSSLIKSSGNLETLYDIVKNAERDQYKGDDAIDMHEFLAATLDINDMILEENLKKAFKMFDKKNSGKIEKHEAKAIYSNANL